jgi:hypothetical protein
MIADVKGARLLQGFPGRPAADLEAIEDALMRVSYLAMHIEGHLAELDVNSLMVLPSGQGVKAVDALVVFRGTIEIAAGLEDIFSINAFVDIARTVLGNAKGYEGGRA